jgi:hypothetical protein
MGEAGRKNQKREERRNEILAAHPHCYFCGGLNPSKSIDHVPPECCFPSGHYPEDFEFAACDACNQGGRKHDQIFGLYSCLTDFDEQKFGSGPDQDRLKKLMKGVERNHPDALPDFETARNIHRSGHIYTPRPVAHSVETTLEMKEAIEFMEEKLTHALYLRDVGKIMTPDHRFVAGVYQPQLDHTRALTDYFQRLLPNTTIGFRSNINEYGDRFRYKSGYKDVEDFFVYASQFGRGCIIWGIVCGPGMPAPNVGPGGSMTPKVGGCGPGRLPWGPTPTCGQPRRTDATDR